MPAKQVAVSPQEMTGRALAVEMFRKLRSEWEGVKIPNGTPDAAISEVMVSREPSTMRAYLAKAQANPAALRGFLCVLSDYIGAEVSACPGFDFDGHFLGKRK